MTTFLVYLYLIVLIIFVIVVWLHGIGLLVSAIRRKAPPVPSPHRLRIAIVDAIARDTPHVETILDIGSGWGGMVRHIARKFPRANVVGIEMLPVPYFYSIIAGMFVRNSKIKFGNAFKYLDDKKFDVGIAYLLRPEMPDMLPFISHFKILYVLDFPLPGVRPVQKIKLHRDYLGQHWLFVYKNKS